MFMDIVKISVKAGNGGNGAVGFHREKYIAKGGPDGGDGGNGGSVIFVASKDENTLIQFRYTKKFVAQAGENGLGSNKTGSDGKDCVVRVPQGTIIRDTQGNILADLFDDGQTVVLQRGGKGGKGNAKFATPTRQSPNFAIPGQVHLPLDVQLELKTIADVGLIGMPNVGKSTLLGVLTAARPKIANYHFTTLAPNLGVVTKDEYSFVLADIPGLIEGAAQGAGLGHDFLRHVERTRMLIHVVDMSGCEGRDPYEDYCKINQELQAYSAKLAERPQIIAANKMDITGAQENLTAFQAQVGDVPVFAVSAAAVQGLDALMRQTVLKLRALPPVVRYEASEHAQVLGQTKFTVEKEDDGVFYVQGSMVNLILRRTDADNDDSMRHFHKLLLDSGIIAALRDAGAKDGDTVIMGEWEFEFVN